MTVTIEDAKNQLGELVAKVAAGESVVITAGEKPVAQLVPVLQPRPMPQFGSCKGMLTIVADDDEHLKDFEEYMS